MKYTVIIEKGQHSYGAYVPDLPGCVAVAETEKEVRKLIVEAIAFHIEGIRMGAKRIPKAKTKTFEFELPV